MRAKESFLHYLYTSRPLEASDFRRLQVNGGIFKQNFMDSGFRKPLLEKFKESIRVSQGGVFLVSGYRGIGKTTFLNYVTYSLSAEDGGPVIFDTFNLSSIGLNLKFEIMCRIIFILQRCGRRFSRDIRRRIDRLYRYLLWERTEAMGIAAGISSPVEFANASKHPEVNFSVSRSREIKQKDNVFYAESELQDLLKAVKKREKVKLVITLDELDKIPLLRPTESEEQERTVKAKEMDWLLKMLSYIKYFLFESGIVFILVVNKNVFDYWKSRHSEEDLFMNLVTDVVYLPGYFKEEMELNPDFQITVDEEAGFPPLSPYAVKRYFQTCLYYESYANPRILFQHMAKRITDNEIRITRKDAEYLTHKVRLHEFSEMIYRYFYENLETNYRRFLSAVDELSGYVRIAVQSRNNPHPFFQAYYGVLQKLDADSQDGERDEERGGRLSEFWDRLGTADAGGDYLFTQLEAFITAIRESDRLDNFPAANYIIRRLTDLAMIIEERHVVSVDRLMAEMQFERYELRDNVGQYLIGLLIPIAFIILQNNNSISLQGNTILFRFRSEENVSEYHRACREEMNGNFEDAMGLYDSYIDSEPRSIDAMNRKLRMLYNIKMMDEGYKGLDFAFEWRNTLSKMDTYFRKSAGAAFTVLDLANFRALADYYNGFLKKAPGYLLFEPRFIPPGFVEFHDIEYLYDKAVGEDPQASLPHLYKGIYLFWHDRLPAALDEYEYALKLDRDSFTLIRKGECLRGMELYQQALDSFREGYERSTSPLHKMLILHCVEQTHVRYVSLKRVRKDDSLPRVFPEDWKWLSEMVRTLKGALSSGQMKTTGSKMQRLIEIYGSVS